MDAILCERMRAELGAHVSLRTRRVALGQATSSLPSPNRSAVRLKPLRRDWMRKPTNALPRLGRAAAMPESSPAAADRPSYKPACV